MLLSVNQAQTQPRSNQAQFNRLLHYYCYYLSLELLEHLEDATEMRVERVGAVQRYNESVAARVSTQAAETRPAASRREMRLQLGFGKVSLSRFQASCSASRRLEAPSVAGAGRDGSTELESDIGPLWSWVLLPGRSHWYVTPLQGQAAARNSKYHCPKANTSWW